MMTFLSAGIGATAESVAFASGITHHKLNHIRFPHRLLRCMCNYEYRAN
jgi:hypothetical protein